MVFIKKNFIVEFFQRVWNRKEQCKMPLCIYCPASVIVSRGTVVFHFYPALKLHYFEANLRHYHFKKLDDVKMKTHFLTKKGKEIQLPR